jgi:phage terminase large subunit-like protein
MGLLTDITNYAQAIVDGKVVACVKHKNACKRWLTDISRQGTEGFQWYFNEEQANRFKTFAEKMKHRKGELAGKPKVLCHYELFVYCGNIYGWWDKNGRPYQFC